VAQGPPLLVVQTQSVHEFINKIWQIHDIYNTIKTHIPSYEFINIRSKEYHEDIFEHYRENREYYSEIFKNLKNRAISSVVLKYLGDKVGIFSAADGRAVKPLSLFAEASCVMFHDVEVEYVADAIQRELAKILKRAPKSLLVGTCDFLSLADKIISTITRSLGSECVVALVSPISLKRPRRELYVAEALAVGLATLCGLRLCQP